MEECVCAHRSVSEYESLIKARDLVSGLSRGCEFGNLPGCQRVKRGIAGSLWSEKVQEGRTHLIRSLTAVFPEL